MQQIPLQSYHIYATDSTTKLSYLCNRFHYKAIIFMQQIPLQNYQHYATNSTAKLSILCNIFHFKLKADTRTRTLLSTCQRHVRCMCICFIFNPESTTEET